MALQALPNISHPELGFVPCVKGKFTGSFFTRDGAKVTEQTLGTPGIHRDRRLLVTGINTLATSAMYMGRRFDRSRDEAYGKKPHEVHTGLSDQTRLSAMGEQGWPVYEDDQGWKRMEVYTAGDATALFNIATYETTMALEQMYGREVSRRFLRVMWPYVAAGLAHDIRKAGMNPLVKGLIYDDPQNPNTLPYHVWNDGIDALRDDNGILPAAPHIFYVNNCDFAASIEKTAVMGEMLGYKQASNKLNERLKWTVPLIHKTFWMDDKGYYSPLKYGEGQLATFMSDCAITGLRRNIIPKTHALRVVDRLHADDMRTKLGVIRTRSELSPFYSEEEYLSYQNGGIWPVRLTDFVKGLKNYGFTHEADDLKQNTAAYILIMQGLYELGINTKEGIPLPYMENGKPAACKDQGWTVGGVVEMTAEDFMSHHQEVPKTQQNKAPIYLNRVLRVDPVLVEALDEAA